MNVVEAFAHTLIDFGMSEITTLGQDLFIGNAPSSNKAPDTLTWLIGSGGNKITTAKSGEAVKSYRVDIYRRDMDYEAIYNFLHALEERLNCSGCTELTGYTTVEVEASVLTIDSDLDNESRKVGLLQANLTIYKEC